MALPTLGQVNVHGWMVHTFATTWSSSSAGLTWCLHRSIPLWKGVELEEVPKRGPVGGPGKLEGVGGPEGGMGEQKETEQVDQSRKGATKIRGIS